MGFGKDGKGVILREDGTTTLGALAADAGLSLAGPTITEDFRMLKSRLFAVLRGIAPGEGAGILLYMCNADLTAAEQEAAVETNGPLDRNDRIQQETAERLVTLIGAVDQVAGADGICTFRDIVTNAPVLTPAMRWTFSNPEGWDYFFYNAGKLVTTGGSIHVHATHFGVWVT